VKYSFIDVELSERYSPEDRGLGIYGRWGQDKTVPEFDNQDVAHDPFKTGIYQLGNVFKRIVQVAPDPISYSISTLTKSLRVQHYTGLSELQPLAEAMTVRVPNDRITAAEACATLAQVVSSLTEHNQSERIFYKTSSEKSRQLLIKSLSPSELLDMDSYLFPERDLGQY
jgi:hypothetical protein